MERRYDIDWLRVIAIALLLIYHIAIVFQPWGVFIGFIQSKESMEWLWGPMSILNVWRIPILFFVSGMGVCFAMRKRNFSQLIWERTRRILFPLLFGMAAIVPLHMFIWQKYYSQDIHYIFHPMHLWFLLYIFIYVLLFSPLFFFLKKHSEGRLGIFLKKLFGKPLGLLVIALSFALEGVLVSPESYSTYSLSLHGFFVGLLSFLFGFLLIYSGEEARQMIIRFRWWSFAGAVGLFAVRLLFFELNSPSYMIGLESVMWIVAVFGFTFRNLNREGKMVKYLSKAAYPVYVLHMVFLYLGSAWILPMEIPVFLKFVLINVVTFAACLFVYEFVVRRVGLIGVLFGLKR